MARIDTLNNFLTDIAAAIKAKKGDSTGIPAADFDTEITNLPSGDDETLIGIIERSLTSITIPSGVTKISNSFENYKNLASIEIPNSVTSIGNSAFYGCTNLTSIEIPNSVISIGVSAFDMCESLTSIQIPNSVTIIGDYVFYRCTKLAEIDMSTFTFIPTLDADPDDVNYAFENCASELQIKVPLALVDEWKLAQNWSIWKNKIVGV